MRIKLRTKVAHVVAQTADGMSDGFREFCSGLADADEERQRLRLGEYRMHRFYWRVSSKTEREREGDAPCFV